MDFKKVWVEKSSLKELLYGINALATGLCDSAFDSTLGGVLENEESATAPYSVGLSKQGENALRYLSQHYETIAASVRMIAAASEIVVDAITNDDISIEWGEEATE